MASHLPSALLDGVLSLPYFLVSIRNWLLPVQALGQAPENIPPPVTAVTQEKSVRTEIKEESQDYTSEIDANSDHDGDIESNSGDTMGSSWVSLNQKKHVDDR